MKRFYAIFLFTCCLVHTGGPFAAETFTGDQDGFLRDAIPLLKTFCLDCHGKETTEGDFRVDTMLSADMSDSVNAARWHEVVNALNSHEMPPQGAPQPEPRKVTRLVDWVTAEFTRAERFNRSTQVVLRRLNRSEYRNTIRDLIGVDFDVSIFPEDASAGGFDNNGAALTVSPMQIELYLKAAREILDKAIVTGEQPAAIRWRFEPESGDSDRNRVKYGDNNVIVNGGQNPLFAGGRLIAFDQWNKTINARDFRVPIAGPYVIRMHVGGKTPSHEETIAKLKQLHHAEYDRRTSENPEQERSHRHGLDLGIEYVEKSWTYRFGPPRIKVTVHQGGQPEVIGETDVTGGTEASSLQTIEMPVEMSTETAGITLQNSYTLRRVLENISIHGHEDFPRPALLVDWFEIEGPVYSNWPPTAHQRLLPEPVPDDQANQRIYARRILRDFMPKAYRREVTNAEVDEKLSLFDVAMGQTDDFIESIKIALSSVLISPNFLYLAESSHSPSTSSSSSTASADALTQSELASRLSYFIWSSMPDDRLTRLAAENRLSDPDVRVAEVDRMLADSKSQSLAENFAAQWLGLREIGNNPPVEELYPRYDEHLEESLGRETKAFFNEILHNDLCLDQFIDSDFLMLNERLARYYEIDGVHGDAMRRVARPVDSHRGGLLTQAAILTTTSNGTRTTPVRRGTWILKSLLDSDPGLPVANAGEISPKVPGIDKATVRQRLEIHRELPQCARCHDKIDPLGFALENFDASGRYRDREGFGYQGRIQDNDPSIDASGLLPDGTRIDGIDGLKQALLDRRELLQRSITRKMFSYALGRELTLVDSAEVDRAVARLTPGNDHVRTIIRSIVASPTFENH